jgi:hypothetical protein
MPLEVRDGKTIYVRETFPYKDSFGTIVLYEMNDGRGLRINLTYPLNEGETHRICKFYEAENDDNDKQ